MFFLFLYRTVYNCTSFRCYHNILYYIHKRILCIYINIEVLLSLCLKSNYRVYILYIQCAATDPKRKNEIIYKSWSAHDSKRRRGVCGGRNEHVVFRAEILNDLKTSLCKYSSTTHVYIYLYNIRLSDQLFETA